MQTVFSEKVDVKLIKLVKAHPVLYDYNDPKYMDFNAREVAWQKIGDDLEKPAADCKVRWINIRDVHRRILRKSITESTRPKRAYKYDKYLEFMKNYYKEIIAVDDLGEDSENDDVDKASEINKSTVWSDDNACDDDYSSDDRVAKPVKKRKKTSKRSKKHSFEEIQMPASTSNESHDLEMNNPVNAFLISIRSTLKRFTPYHLNLARSKIYHIVQEHDLQQIVESKPRSETITITDTPIYFE